MKYIIEENTCGEVKRHESVVEMSFCLSKARSLMKRDGGRVESVPGRIRILVYRGFTRVYHDFIPKDQFEYGTLRQRLSEINPKFASSDFT